MMHFKTPQWVERLDAWGKSPKYNPATDWRVRKAGYAATILINVVLLCIWGYLPRLLSFITPAFNDLLPFFYFSFAATIVANLLFLFWDQRLFRALLKGGLNVISIIVMLEVFVVFPFDFSAYPTVNWDVIVRILMILGMIGTIIGTIVEFFKALMGVGE